jgi:hypothetical protein
MSDEKKNLRQRMAAKRRTGQIVLVDVPGLGAVGFRMINSGQAVDFVNLLAAVAATAVDEEGAELYANEAAARAEHWPIMRALLGAYDKVNTLDVEEAAKN